MASFQTLKCLVLYSVTGQMLLPEDLLSLLSTACDRILCIRKTPLSFQLYGEESFCLIIYLCLEMCAVEVCAMDSVPERLPKSSFWRWYGGYGWTCCEIRQVKIITRASTLLLCRWLKQSMMDLGLNIQFSIAVPRVRTRMFPFADSQGTWICFSIFYCFRFFSFCCFSFLWIELSVMQWET